MNDHEPSHEAGPLFGELDEKRGEQETSRYPTLETREQAENHEAEARDGPRIYVASLSDYNAGVLHGRWIEAVEDPEMMQDEVDEMLVASPTTARYGDIAEEWAIHDYEGFGALRVDENEALSTIANLASGIKTHGLAFAAWAADVGERGEDLIERFEDRYQGRWHSVESYAEDMLNELGAEQVIADAPEWVQPYLKLDVAGFARDLEISRDITTAESPDGGVWVWSGW